MESTGSHPAHQLERVSTVSAAETLQGSIHSAGTVGIELDRLSRALILTVEAGEDLSSSNPFTEDDAQSQEHERGNVEDQRLTESATQIEQAPLADRTPVTTAAPILHPSLTVPGISSSAGTTSDDVLRFVNAPGYDSISDEQRGKNREEALKQLEGH
jgi:hypothetical protein